MSPPTETRLEDVLEDAKLRFTEQNQRSKSLHEEATRSLPGGNTRTVLHTSPFPVYMKSGKGYQVVSEDGKTYTDLTGEFTAALYGHSNPEILSTITHVIQNVGMNVGATTVQENKLASELCSRFHLERVRFANSGTEANIHALSAARLFTGRRKVVAFGGAYHGSVLGFAGGRPAANNVDLDDWIIARYNDLESANEALQCEGVAAVILEGMQGAGGCFPATEDFLRGVQKTAKKAGVLFILDEVMTSRLSGHGLAHMHGLQPDLKTFGKWLGGGMAFGAFGGRADIMAAFDPRLQGSISHSGTFNNNTLVTHAGHTGLTRVYTPSVASEFTKVGEQLRARLNEVAKGTRMCFTGMGTVMAIHIVAGDTSQPLLRGDELSELQTLRDLFWFEMLDEGFWIARRGLMALILHTPQDELDRFEGAVRRFIVKYHEFLLIE